MEHTFRQKQNSSGTDYGINAVVEGIEIRCYRLEVVKIMKEKSKKKKDREDLAVIDDFGYEQEVYIDLKRRLETMKYQMIPKNRLLQFFFR